MNTDPLFTVVADRREEIELPDNAVYIHAVPEDPRGEISSAWRQEAERRGTVFYSVTDSILDLSSIELCSTVSRVSIKTRNRNSAKEFWRSLREARVYLDVTEMALHSIGTLLQGLLESDVDIRVVYVEPAVYSAHREPNGDELFDLSMETRSSRLSQLPGLEAIASPNRPASDILVPLLGFEGHRLAYLVQELEPSEGSLEPILGNPGFHPEYVFYAAHANGSVLRRKNLWRRLRYALANSVSDGVYAIVGVLKDYPDDVIQTAPLGTKPHAVAALLARILWPTRVQLVYDFPVPRSGRTSGSGQALQYDVRSLIDHVNGLI